MSIAPVLFLSHGSPMRVIEQSPARIFLAELGQSIVEEVANKSPDVPCAFCNVSLSGQIRGRMDVMASPLQAF